MKANAAELLRRMRREIKISQAELAEKLFVSPRQISRIETGQISVDIWQFISMMELLGYPPEDFWLLYLESEEYEGYKLYRRLRLLSFDDDNEEKKEIIGKLKSYGLAEKPFIKQYVALSEIVPKINANEIPYNQIIKELTDILLISMKEFDERKLHIYRLTHNEINVLCVMAASMFEHGEKDKGISMMEAIISGKHNVIASEADKGDALAHLYSNLSTMLMKAKKYDDCIHYSQQLLNICRTYDKMHPSLVALYNMSVCYNGIGEEQMYKIYLTRAYNLAKILRFDLIAQFAKKSLEKDFGLIDLQ